MKKILALLIAVLVMAFSVFCVSAEVSPTPPIVNDKIIIDAIPVPGNAGVCTPDIENPFEYIVGSDGKVTLTASSVDGFKFTHWEFITGDFDIIEGSLTSATIVIMPRPGSSNIRAEAYFVKEGASEPTVPDSKPITPPDDDDKSPTTGDTTAIYAIGAAVVLMIGFTVVVLKKKAC